MPPESRVGRLLDEEHRASLDLLNRLDAALARRDGAALQALLGPLVRALAHETGHHFAFEERELFPRMATAGDEDLAVLLAEEHETLRAVAAELLPLAEAARRGDGALPEEPFRRLAQEWSERLVAHVQKETMALLPLLPDLLDEHSDGELALAYAAA
jgi:hemerythrin-like domain-containing protein